VTTDRELADRMLAGDQAAFSEFFETHFSRVYRFALPRVAGNEDAAREAVQRAMIKAMRKLSAWRGEATLFTWLCQICRREIFDQARSNRRRADNVVLIEDSAEVRQALEFIEAPASTDPLRQCSRQDLQRIIQAVLDRLPDRYGEALELKYIEGCSVEEISKTMGIGPTAAQSLLARARTAFREALEAVFGASSSDLLSSLEA
jgi:RNA polymerase sigma-70 factor (ECF subfamily)